MTTSVVSITVNAQGAGDDYDDARSRALTRLMAAANALKNGQTPDDPGVNLDDRDPGGGGGPCAPRHYTVEIIVDASVLPEAQGGDD